MKVIRRMQAFWAGDGYSCFWTPEYGVQYYHPCRDMEALHDIYGGENYYTSRSGRSGAGYLLPDPGDILVEFGFYRVDTGPGPGHQQKAVVGSFLRSGPCYAGDTSPIFGYLPVANGGEPGNYPAVLTDGERICFVDPHYSDPLPQAIQGWNSLPWDEAKEIEFTYYSYSYGSLVREGKVFRLLANGYRGVNALRFADIRMAQKYALLQAEKMTAPCRWMNILDVRTDGRRVCVFDPLFGHIVDRFDYSPIQGWPGQINGWDVDTETPGQLFCYRQRENFQVIAMAVNLETNRDVEKTFLAMGFDPEETQKELFQELAELGEAAAI